MINFKSPDISDRQWIRDICFGSGLRSADYSFGAIYCWESLYSSKIANVEGMLVIKAVSDGDVYYYFPIGNGDLAEALSAMRRDADAAGSPFRLCGITGKNLPAVKAVFPDEPDISFSENFSDYVYSAVSLSQLSGRKYHQKKNHVNRFMAENEWSFEPLTSDIIPECRQLAGTWFAEAEAERDSGFMGEILAIQRTFDNWSSLQMEGGVIRVEGKVAAFTIGELISPDTFDTHFEKASPHLNGAYSAINQQFAQYLLTKHPDLVYINREEDMGLENLRKGKQSYHPEFMVDKYVATWK